MAFNLLAAILPDDVVDQIARTVHRGNMEPVLATVGGSVLRRAMSETERELLPHLRTQYPGMTWGADYSDPSYTVFYVYFVTSDRVIVYTTAKTLIEYLVRRCGTQVELETVAAYGNDIPLPSRFLPYMSMAYNKRVVLADTKRVKPLCTTVSWDCLMNKRTWSI